jgi:hypothetical protein
MKINPNFGGIRFLTFGTDASYEALTVSVQKRMSHGFQFGGFYTYSKAMDNSSATIAGDAFSNSITSWLWFAPQISHSVSDFNVPHSVVINGIWQVPGPRAGLAHAVLGGWEMVSILKMNNGIPTTPIIAGDPLGIQNAGTDQFSIPSLVSGCNPVNTNFKSNPGGVSLGYINTSCYTLPQATPAIAAQCVPFPNSKGNPIPGTCANLLGDAGRNSIVGPSLVNLDFALYKNMAVRKISESFNVQFRAEFFNVLNHANFLPPTDFQNSNTAQLYTFSSTATSSPGNAGSLTTISALPRVIQFALKVIF